jgi:hypothetical protein
LPMVICRHRAEVTDGYPCIAAQFHVHPSTRHAVLR